MGIGKCFPRHKGGVQTLSKDTVLRSRSTKARRAPRRSCSTAASKRARRYVAKHRLSRSLWPILAVFYLVTIIFGRPSRAANARAIVLKRLTGKEARALRNGPDEEDSILPFETGATLDGEAASQYRPPVNFQAKQAAQVVALLVRNRGRMDTAAVHEKWKHLDQYSLPLALYLRDVDSKCEWSALEEEIASSLCTMKLRPNTPTSIRHRKILELIPEWARRGEELLVLIDANASAAAVVSDHQLDGDKIPPQPTRP